MSSIRSKNSKCKPRNKRDAIVAEKSFLNKRDIECLVMETAMELELEREQRYIAKSRCWRHGAFCD